MIYWDYNATAPVRHLVKAKVIEALESFSGNPSSPHALGQSSKAYIETVRRRLCEAIGLKPTDLVFCASATEGNWMALWGHWFYEKKRAKEEGRNPKKLLVGPLEHASVEKNVKSLVELEGVEVLEIPLQKSGVIDLKATEKILAETSLFLVSMHAACNETGIVQAWEDLAHLCQAYKVPFHSDLVQLLGRVPFHLNNIPMSSGTLAFHKCGGLKGIGAFFIRHAQWVPPLAGGSQEKKRRAGTENVLGIASIDALVEELDQIIDAYQGPILALRESFEKRLKEKLPQVKIVGEDLRRLPNTSFCIFPGIAADAMLMSLDIANICSSAGSACSSGLAEPSSKLLHLGYSPEEAQCGIRFSLGESSHPDDIDKIISVIDKTIKRMAA
jgi:cysteine desulfurase